MQLIKNPCVAQNQNAPGSKGPDTSNYNGVYLNKSMSHALTALVGTKVVVKVRNQEHQYEGFFHCFSQNMDLVVSGVHKVSFQPNSKRRIRIRKFIDHIFHRN